MSAQPISKLSQYMRRIEPQASLFRVTLTRSPRHLREESQKTIKCLGLWKINSTQIHKNNSCFRGYVDKVKWYVKVEEYQLPSNIPK
ncbi:50S ribosomal protein L30 [Planoprotostelium fungivorum]|uniref:Large ribosomal subunit protein uL30m n=1 Tax=Planoprotostelium fungivorum TaxID=1890364 RepID=A0A2P6NUW9_9EUKA|nr:50S ribosomal protein L30 [Planoprotostelium fungivorum]